MDYYICETFYLSLMVTTKQKNYSRFTKNKEKEIRAHCHRKPPITKVSSRWEKKKTKYFGTTKYKAINKMASWSPNISIISLKVNGFSSPIKRCRVARWKNKKTQLYAVRDSLRLLIAQKHKNPERLLRTIIC